MRYTVTSLKKAPKDRLVVRVSATCWLVGDFTDTKETLSKLFPDKSVWAYYKGSWAVQA